jgi:protein pelota
MFTADPSRTAYGLEAVTSANDQQAIAELLITDKVYRTDDFVARNKFVDLVEAVKAAGGAVYKFSSMHVSGEKLDLYTGIAATLRFSVEVAELDERPVELPGQSGEARRKRSDSKAAKESEDFSSLMEEDEGGI